MGLIGPTQLPQPLMKVLEMVSKPGDGMGDGVGDDVGDGNGEWIGMNMERVMALSRVVVVW